MAALGVADALSLVGGGSPGAAGANQLVAVLAAAVLGGGALSWIVFDQRLSRTPIAWVMALALVLRLVAIQASPLLEDDHFRYLWDGMRTATAFDPYRLPPAAFFGVAELPARWQDILSGINNPDIPTIYGPLLQWLFALAYWIAPGRVEAIQGLLLAADMAVLALLVRQGIGTRWLLAYAVHPLILKEAMASAHPDGVVALLLLLAMLAWQQRFAWRVGLMLGLAISTKVAALVALPLLLLAPMTTESNTFFPATSVRWLFQVAAGMTLALAVLYLPFLAVNGGSDGEALGIFGQHWRFNPLFYRLLEIVCTEPWTRILAATAITLGIALIGWRWRRRAAWAADSPLPPLDMVLALLIALSPVVNPWYWLWALPLSIRLGHGWVVAGGAVAVISYLNSTVLFEAGVWREAGSIVPYSVSWPLALVQMLVIVALMYHGSRDHRSRRSSAPHLRS